MSFTFIPNYKSFLEEIILIKETGLEPCNTCWQCIAYILKATSSYETVWIPVSSSNGQSRNAMMSVIIGIPSSTRSWTRIFGLSIDFTVDFISISELTIQDTSRSMYLFVSAGCFPRWDIYSTTLAWLCLTIS